MQQRAARADASERGVAAAPEQDDERRQEREAEQAGAGREAAEHARGHRPPAHRGEEGAGGEREEEPVRVDGA